MLSGEWWFVTAYVLLLLLAPSLHIYFAEENKKQNIIFLVCLWLLYECNPFSVLQVVLRGCFFFVSGMYIRKYDIRGKKKYLLFALLFWIVAGIVIYIKNLNEFNQSKWQPIFNYVCMIVHSGFCTPVISVSMFLVFKSLQINGSAIINEIAKTTFGVYLLHENVFMRFFIWDNLLHVTEQYATRFFLLYALFSTIVVFCVCSFIDYLRAKYVFPMVNKLRDKIALK